MKDGNMLTCDSSLPAGHLICTHYPDGDEIKFTHLTLDNKHNVLQRVPKKCVLVFVIGGTAGIQTSAHPFELDVPAGELICIPPGHAMAIWGKPECELILLYFSKLNSCGGNLLQELAKEADGKEVTGVLRSYPIVPPLSMFLQGLIFYIDNKIHCVNLQNIKQEECLSIIRICYSHADQRGIFSSILSKDIMLRLKIMQTADSVCSVKELAHVCELSEATLKRKMQQLFGVSPYQWLLSKRNRNILFNLRRGEDLQEVATRYQFYSVRNLSRYCRRYFGVSASEISRLENDRYTEIWYNEAR